MTRGSDPFASRPPATEPSLRGVLGLWWPLFSVFLVLCLAVSWWLWNGYQQAVKDAERNAIGTSHFLSVHLAREFEGIAGALQQLADYSRRSGGPNSSGEGWMQMLGTALSGMPGVDSVSVTDASGKVSFSSSLEAMAGIKLADAAYRKLSADPKTNALIVDLPWRSTINGRIVVPVARVIRTTGGAFEGMLVATLSPEQLRPLYAAAQMDTRKTLWLVHPSGQTLLREPSSETAGPMPELPIGDHTHPGRDSGLVFHELEAAGERHLIAFETEIQSRLSVAASFAESRLFERWRTEMRAAIAFLAAIALLLALTGFYVNREYRDGRRV